MRRELAIEFSRVTEAAALAGYNGWDAAIKYRRRRGGQRHAYRAQPGQH